MTQTHRLIKLTHFLVLLMCGLVPFVAFMVYLTRQMGGFVDDALPNFSVLVGLESIVIAVAAVGTMAMAFTRGQSGWGRSTVRLLFLFALPVFAGGGVMADWAVLNEWASVSGWVRVSFALYALTSTLFCGLLTWLSLRAVDVLRRASDMTPEDNHSIYYVSALTGLFLALSAVRTLVVGALGASYGVQLSGAGLFVCGVPGWAVWNWGLFLAGLFLCVPDRTAEVAALAVALLIVAAVPLVLAGSLHSLGMNFGSVPALFTVYMAALGVYLFCWLSAELAWARMRQAEVVAWELANF